MIVIGIISLLLDLTVLNFINFSFLNIKIIFPMLTFVYLVSNLYYFNNYKKVDFILILILYGIINNNIFLTILNFLIIYQSIRKLKKQNYFLVLVLSIFLYDTINYLFLTICGYLQFNLYFIFYKFYNSLVLNLIWGLIFYLCLSGSKKRKIE